MIRVLVMIAIAGALVSIATLSVAVGLVGPEAITHGAWSFGPTGWGWTDHHRPWRSDDDEGQETTRDLAWSGGDSLDIDVPADVRYTQAAGPAKLTVTGPSGAVADLRLKDGHLEYQDGDDHDQRLTVVVSAPAVTHFAMESSGKLEISNFQQDKLGIDVDGDGRVSASGETNAVSLNISGSADADLGAIKAKVAVVAVDGSGDAVLSASEMANVTISGSGDVTLLTKPSTLQTHISGSGRVRQNNGASLGAKDDEG